MKHLIYIITFISFSAFAQNKYITKTGQVNFEASVPSFEEVKANNNAVTAIINVETGEFAALAFVKGFRFKNALMEEHFNENYAESDTYPKATFKGTIKGFSMETLKTQSTFEISGSLTFHGKTKPLDTIVLNITEAEETISMSGNFMTNASDFDIKIPKIVRNKIANDIEVSFNFELKKK